MYNLAISTNANNPTDSGLSYMYSIATIFVGRPSSVQGMQQLTLHSGGAELHYCHHHPARCRDDYDMGILRYVFVKLNIVIRY